MSRLAWYEENHQESRITVRLVLVLSQILVTVILLTADSLLEGASGVCACEVFL